MPRTKQSTKKDSVPALLLVDGDILLHLACESFTANEPMDESGDYWTYVTHVPSAVNWFVNRVETIQKTIQEDSEAVVAFSSAPNWRLDVLPSYKSNRKSVKKPPGFGEAKERLIKHYGELCRIVEGLEADDILGILATHPDLLSEGKVYIWSTDKDLKSVPGTLIRGDEVLEISELEADRFHMIQTLAGDAVDGYKGCPGIGVVKAEEILGELPREEWWSKVVETYEKRGLTEEDALVQSRVARILRFTDWDSVNKKPLLWSPPNVPD